MALSVKRFIAWFIVGAVAIWAGWVGAMAAGSRGHWISGRMSSAQQARRYAAAIGMLERRDSIALALRTRPAANGLSIVITNAAPASDRAVVDSTIRAFWRRSVPGTAVRPVIVLVTDTRTAPESDNIIPREVSFVLEPGQLDGRSCVIVLAAREFVKGNGKTLAASALTLAGMLESTGGICTLHAKYGEPGEGIRHWLASVNWSPASSTESDADSATAPPVFRAADSAARKPVQFGTSAGMVTNEEFSAGGRTWGLRFPHIACLAGDSEACETIASAAEPFYASRYSNALIPSGVVRIPGGLYRGQGWNKQLVASLEEQLGAEKFAAFWTSAKPPAEAMVDATGRTTGSWVGERLEQSHRPLVSSPWPTALDWLIQLSLIGLPIGLVVLTRQRRFLSA